MAYKMSLTPKQEKFASCIADGMSQADAYRAAYGAEKMSDNAIYSEASLLLKNPKVSQRVAELKGDLATKALWTREMSARALVNAYEYGNPNVKVSAVRELNLMHGYNAPQKLKVAWGDGAPLFDASVLSTAALAEILAAKNASNAK